jgi:RNA polymerase sigma-70 factor, ECF subfamily
MIIPKNIEENRLAAACSSSVFDMDAFSRLFEDHKNLVYKTAFLMLGSEADAEEALQEVFIRVYKSLASYDPQKGAFSTWLHRITINYCLGHRRKHRPSFQSLEAETREMAGEPDEANPAIVAEKKVVREMVEQLDGKHRAVLVLRFYSGLPYAEIASVLEIPLGTVKSRIVHALKTLRQKLSDPGNMENGALHGEEKES